MKIPPLITYRTGIFSRTYLTRDALLPADESPWRHLLQSRCDTSFIHVTSLSYVCCFFSMSLWSIISFIVQEIFVSILPQFTLEFGPTYSIGRPRCLKAEDSLGLALVFLSTSLTNKALQLIFGIGPAVCSQEIHRATKALLRLVFGSVVWMFANIFYVQNAP